jgi:UDP-N-acetylglucosamine--N-acetylmuramyl-(pentapeptide) pyrophosphoryl-undecaprenol N-acetylglucosamine transferase
MEPEKKDFLWVGGAGGMEAELVKRQGVPYMEIPAAGVHGVGLRALPGDLLRLGRGFLASRNILAQYRPDVLLFTGGYVAVPMALASRLIPSSRRPKVLLYVPDIEPALALQTLARFADRIAVTTETSEQYYSRGEKLTVTGYPVRKDLQAWDREAARQGLGLNAQTPMLLVSGGSRGARSINRALIAALPDLLEEMQIVHVSGKLDWAEVEAAAGSLPVELKARYRAFPYLHEEMGAALTAADLVLSRAGASVLGEYPLFGLPAVLAPYPYAWKYQRTNAGYLSEHGAAVIIEDNELPAKMAPLVKELMSDPARREKMSREMRSLARPHAAQEIAQQLKQMAT